MSNAAIQKFDDKNFAEAYLNTMCGWPDAKVEELNDENGKVYFAICTDDYPAKYLRIDGYIY